MNPKEKYTQQDASYGVVPIHEKSEGEFLYLLVQHREGHWGFPKGHMEKGEAPIQTATRELAEETGITNIDIDENVIESEQYIIDHKPGTKSDFPGRYTRKTVTYFFGFTHQMKVLYAGIDEEIINYVWLPFKDAMERLTYEEARTILKKAHQYAVTLK
jgi:bis(5'-nucleosidyl)-tetraphosphatase